MITVDLNLLFVVTFIHILSLHKNLVGHGVNMDVQAETLADFAKRIHSYYDESTQYEFWYPMFYSGIIDERDKYAWVQQNYYKFLNGTQNKIAYNRWYFTESGYITALQFSPNGSQIIVGHSTGLIQVQHRPLSWFNKFQTGHYKGESELRTLKELVTQHNLRQ